MGLIFCKICVDHKRDVNTICVVETPADVLAVESSNSFRGIYFVLMGHLSPIDGIGPDEIKINELLARIDSNRIEEILIATSSTVPGEATASYLIDRLQTLSIKLTRLACGIPMGMDIKHADKYTLAKAIERRSHAS